MLTVGSLFSGIGGLDLGLERAGMVVKWQVEIDPYCQRVLAKHWPNVKRYEDVREVGKHNLEPVDLICGGFPCQDISIAGKKRGIAGQRSGLWAEFRRTVYEIRPKIVLVENVAALLVRGIGRVLGDLAELGFDARWGVLPVCAFGAPHTRTRVFIIADCRGERGWGGGHHMPMCPRFDTWQASEDKCLWRDMECWLKSLVSDGDGLLPAAELCRVPDGIPYRVDRLRGLGNAVVPQVAQFIGERIMQAIASTPDVV